MHFAMKLVIAILMQMLAENEISTLDCFRVRKCKDDFNIFRQSASGCLEIWSSRRKDFGLELRKCDRTASCWYKWDVFQFRMRGSGSSRGWRLETGGVCVLHLLSGYHNFHAFIYYFLLWKNDETSTMTLKTIITKNILQILTSE